MNDIWTDKKPDRDKVEKIARILNCHRIIALLLVNRGVDTPERAFPFLVPSLKDITDPFALRDMDKAVLRICTAIENREKILIFGDFDADGVTSTSLLNDFLSYADAEVAWYIPHRIKEGHGLQKNHINMAVDLNIDLIITVDCGSDGNEAVMAARKEDIDVIITDHHETAKPLPSAVAIVNPKREDCTADLGYLAGVGVAFYLVIALRQQLRKTGYWKEIVEPNLLQYCDLVALGTIADMVPLKNENRILTKTGITVMRKGERVGFKALSDISKIDYNKIDSEDISFKIAPRINAAGRISHARICVNLLTSKEKTGADQTADILDQLNKKRQQTEQSIMDDIEKKFLRKPEIMKNSIIVLWDKKWNPGVLGIAASKISKKHTRPVILISTTATPATGSCRSIGNININQALKQCSSFLEKFGGHAMAAGLAIKENNLEDFSKAMEKEIAVSTCEEDFKKSFSIDCYLDLKDITKDLLNEIDRLRPFGMDNPEPVFACSSVKVISSFLIGNKHRKMVLEQSGATMEAIHFNIENPADLPVFFDKIAFKLKVNRFKNRNTLQIIIEHI